MTTPIGLTMSVRSVDTPGRTVVGVVAPYNETSYLVPDPRGERILRGAFARSIKNRGNKVPLYGNHDHGYVMGTSRAFTEGPDGLVGEFRINDGDLGETFLGQIRDGYLPYMSVGFMPTADGVSKADDGVTEIREAKLIEVSMVGLPAYAGAELLAVRTGDARQSLEDIFAPFHDVPKFNLDPAPVFEYRPRR